MKHFLPTFFLFLMASAGILNIGDGGFGIGVLLYVCSVELSAKQNKSSCLSGFH